MTSIHLDKRTLIDDGDEQIRVVLDGADVAHITIIDWSSLPYDWESIRIALGMLQTNRVSLSCEIPATTDELQ